MISLRRRYYAIRRYFDDLEVESLRKNTYTEQRRSTSPSTGYTQLGYVLVLTIQKEAFAGYIHASIVLLDGVAVQAANIAFSLVACSYSLWPAEFCLETVWESPRYRGLGNVSKEF